MWSQTKGFDVWWVITLRKFLQAINHSEKDKWRRLFQTVQYFPKPGVGVRQVQGLAQSMSVLYMRALQTGRFGQFPNRQLINMETDGNKHLSWCQDRKMNDFHNTRVSITRQTPNPKS